MNDRKGNKKGMRSRFHMMALLAIICWTAIATGSFSYHYFDAKIFGIIWAIGLITLILVTLYVRRRIAEREQAVETLRESAGAARIQAQENELIAEIGRIISSTLTIEKVYGRFAEKVRDAIPFDQIVVNTVNRQDHTRTARYIAGT